MGSCYNLCSGDGLQKREGKKEEPANLLQGVMINAYSSAGNFTSRLQRAFGFNK